MAVFISGESLLASKVFTAPTRILAKRAIRLASEGSVGQYEVQDVEKLGRFPLVGRCQRLEEINGRRGFWGGLAKEFGQRLCLISGLDSLDVVEIVWIEKLCAIGGPYKMCFRADHFLDALSVTIGYDADRAEVEQEHFRVFDDVAKDRHLIGGAHLPFPGLGHVRTNGKKSYAFVPFT